MRRVGAKLLWIALALAGAWAYATLALHRGEPLNSAYILAAALCTYAIGYRFYSKWIAVRVLMLDERRATPCEVHDDGRDFVKTNKWIVFGHHFAAISGPGPLVGPVLAAQFGYLPGTLWILIGVVLGGAVQDFVILFCSLRRDGRSLGQMVKEELNTPAGYIALVAILAIMVILLAVLGLVVVKALAESPWGVFTVGATIPIAMFMGGYLRFVRVGKVMEASAIGVICLLLAVWGGKLVYEDAQWSTVFGFKAITLAWALIVYGLAASVLPVWLLLAPRDYLSTFMKLGTIFALAVGIFCVLPDLQMPVLTRFVDGSGLVVAGAVFPFCFITIACGAISGFHTLIASGTTPKLITRESYARPIGYGAMCLESLVAIMAMIAACTMEPGVYFAMNVPGAAAETAAKVSDLGFPVTVEHMNAFARQVGEHTLFGRTGGAATLAVGMAQIFSNVVGRRWLDLWYHFAIMFEALFILTTIDAGTRVARYILQDFLGSLWKPLADTRNLGANLVASGLMVCGWGYFLVQGVRDPLGGINSLWPLFGIANQMLAAIALCLATTIILKMALGGAPASGPAPVAEFESRERERVGTFDQTPTLTPSLSRRTGEGGPALAGPGLRRAEVASATQAGEGNARFVGGERRAETVPGAPKRSPWFALIAFVPLVWLVAVTFTAGVEKVFHPDTRIGFIAAARDFDAKLSAGEKAHGELRESGSVEKRTAAEKEMRRFRTLRNNNVIDAVVALVFLVLVTLIVLVSIREWRLLLSGRKPVRLRETEPVWLPDYAVAEGGRKWGGAAGTAALALALAKELSGEAQLERAQRESTACACRRNHGPEPVAAKSDARLYTELMEQRFNGVRRCC